MATVAFSIHCYAGDKKRLYTNLDNIIDSHNYKFDQVIIVHQKTPALYCPLNLNRTNVEVAEEDYDRLFKKYGIPIKDRLADEITHGATSPHYWKHHCVNHLAGLEAASTDYIVFSDSDCVMITNEPHSWVNEAIKQLNKDSSLLVISPSDGAPGKTWIMSQQLFMIRKKDMEAVDWTCWNGQFVDGGPFQEYYVMAEGRIGAYMMAHYKTRLVLGNNWRYWHDWAAHNVPNKYKDKIRGLK